MTERENANTRTVADPRDVRDDDSGQIMLLALAYGVLALLLVTTVASATAVHLERKHLFALADLAALGAADAMDDAAYFTREPGDSLLILDQRHVEEAVLSYLSEAGAQTDLDDVTLQSVTTDGRTVTVTLRAVARPALISWVTAPWSDGIELVVTASARAG